MRHRTGDCGCRNTQSFGGDKCCGSALQTPPTPCCETHEPQYVFGGCLYLTCPVTASKDKFYLTFQGPFSDAIPVDTSEIFFFHAAAKLIKILGFNGTSYEVTLADPSKDGVGIGVNDCIVLYVQPGNTVGSNTLQRCLTGQFLAPALNQQRIMYIVNGTAIPVGATVTIVWQGNVGSYTVVSYEGGAENVYAYVVENTGSGLTPGTFVDGGEANAGCAVPVEIITSVDICETSESQELSVIAGCFNGSPRSLKPTSVNQIPVANEALGWGLRTLSDSNCCMTTEGCLKFTLSSGCGDTDATTVKNVGLDCMTAAWDDAELYGTNVPAIIDGFPYLITGWNPETRTVTIMPVGVEAFDGEEILEIEAGAQICLGSCCNTCVSGYQSTVENQNDFENPLVDANFAFAEPVNIAYNDADPIMALIGIKPDGTSSFEIIDAGYHLTGNPLPQHSDPLLIRQKICNNSVKGCNQKVEFRYNFDILFLDIPEGMRVHWEVGHFVAESATLEDGTTPNPNDYAASQAKVTGVIDGPTYNDATFTPGTGLGFAGPTQPKKFPHPAGSLYDESMCKKCDCINAVLWLFVFLDPQGDFTGTGDIGIQPTWRRILKQYDVDSISNVENLPSLEGWAE